MLERRHYKELAELISNHAFASDSERNAFLWNLCDMLEKNNPRFARTRFVNAAAGSMPVEACFPLTK